MSLRRAATIAPHTPAPVPLVVPHADGWFGRLCSRRRQADDARRGGLPAGSGPWTQGYAVEHRGKRFVDPTLVLKRGESVKIDFENALSEPTIVHWHGLAVDTHNDGGAVMPVAAGEVALCIQHSDVRDRGALYWYHPHPHGLTAGQAYRGMFGMIEVEDDDERALRSALDLVPGKSEIPLILQDRRGAEYAPTDVDRIHGWFGNDVHVNGSVCPFLDVASRVYRFRVLNASNARTYRLGLRNADGKPLPPHADRHRRRTAAQGTASLRRCVSRIGRAPSTSSSISATPLSATPFCSETRAFDPMHMETPASGAPADHAAHQHMGAGAAEPVMPPMMDHGSHGARLIWRGYAASAAAAAGARARCIPARHSRADVDDRADRPHRRGRAPPAPWLRQRTVAHQRSCLRDGRDTD